MINKLYIFGCEAVIAKLIFIYLNLYIISYIIILFLLIFIGYKSKYCILYYSKKLNSLHDHIKKNKYHLKV